jgi:hypothetical protein
MADAVRAEKMMGAPPPHILICYARAGECNAEGCNGYEYPNGLFRNAAGFLSQKNKAGTFARLVRQSVP